MQTLKGDWHQALKPELDKPYFDLLSQFVDSEYRAYNIYPPQCDIFRAFELTPLSKVKVLILGQDPYHGQGQAHGLAFSVKEGIKLPPSLKNIYKELASDTIIRTSSDLTNWAEQGVLLLNTVLTVRAGEANSHRGKGWEQFTDAVIKAVNQQQRPIVSMLWGKPAQKKKTLLNNPHHLVLEAPHPSPLSAYRGFFGCQHFSKANQFLIEHGIRPIKW